MLFCSICILDLEVNDHCNYGSYGFSTTNSTNFIITKNERPYSVQNIWLKIVWDKLTIAILIETIDIDVYTFSSHIKWCSVKYLFICLVAVTNHVSRIIVEKNTINAVSNRVHWAKLICTNSLRNKCKQIKWNKRQIELWN